MKTYTITEMARIVKIPASTATYYKNRHPDFFYSVGSGRRKRYKPEALESLKLIVKMADNNANKEDIEEALAQAKPRSIEVQQKNNNSLTTEQQQPVKLVSLLDKLVDQKTKIESHDSKIEALEQEVKELKEFIKKNQLTWWQKLLNRKPNN